MGVLRGTRVAGLGEEEEGMMRRERLWRKVEKEEGARDVGTGGLGESWGPQFPLLGYLACDMPLTQTQCLNPLESLGAP